MLCSFLQRALRKSPFPSFMLEPNPTGFGLTVEACWSQKLGDTLRLVSCCFLSSFFLAFFFRKQFFKDGLSVAEFFEVLPRTLWVAFAIYVPLGFINATCTRISRVVMMAAWGPSNQTCDLLGILSPSSGVSRPYFWLELGWKLNETHEKG